jgi:hypothetical protein
MKSITRERVKFDGAACPWLIRKFVHKDAQFTFVPADKVMNEAKRQNTIRYGVKDVEPGHHGNECSFEAILKKPSSANPPSAGAPAGLIWRPKGGHAAGAASFLVATWDRVRPSS